MRVSRFAAQSRRPQQSEGHYRSKQDTNTPQHMMHRILFLFEIDQECKVGEPSRVRAHVTCRSDKASYGPMIGGPASVPRTRVFYDFERRSKTRNYNQLKCL